MGSLSVQCTLTFGATEASECLGTAILFDRGKITLAGNVPNYPRFAVAITGGTLEFRGARGQVFVNDNSGSDRVPSRLTRTEREPAAFGASSLGVHGAQGLRRIAGRAFAIGRSQGCIPSAVRSSPPVSLARSKACMK